MRLLRGRSNREKNALDAGQALTLREPCLTAIAGFTQIESPFTPPHARAHARIPRWTVAGIALLEENSATCRMARQPDPHQDGAPADIRTNNDGRDKEGDRSMKPIAASQHSSRRPYC
jgi:hypothetical protein